MDHTPTIPASQCSCFRARRLARLLSQRYDRALAPLGLTVNQYSILRRASREAQPLGALACELGMDRTTLTRDLRPLQADGRIELSADKSDARVRKVRVTASGKRLLARAQPLWRDAQDAVESALGAALTIDLHTGIDRAMAILDRETNA